jgi:VCBS repeat-containing protein
MKSIPLALAVGAVGVLLASSLAPAQSIQYVIHVSVDGLRPDAITSQTAAQLPNFYRLRNEGARTDNARADYDYTETLMNHTDLTTGRGVYGPAGASHEWDTNSWTTGDPTLHQNKGSYVAAVFDVAHDNGLRTGLYASKSKFALFDTSWNATNGAPDVTGLDNGRDKIDVYRYLDSTSSLTSNWVSDMTSDPQQYSFIHFRDPDTAGHASGWMSSSYLAAVRTVDSYLGQIFTRALSAPFAGKTAIIVTADHGGTGTVHDVASTATNYTIPLMVWGPGIPAGEDLYVMNSTTRQNPGTGRPTWTAATPPIRNGDTPNLALELLGLGAIPGSGINAAQNLDVFTVPNHAPVAVGDVYPGSEDSPITIAASGVLGNDSDADNDPLSAIQYSGASHGNVTLNADGAFTYLPGANYNGPDSFTYRAFDGALYSNTATVTLNIAAMNDAPIAGENFYSVAKNGSLVAYSYEGVLKNDSDVEGSPLSAVKFSDTAHGAVTLYSSGALTYTPQTDFIGEDSFLYRAYDGAAYSDPTAVFIEVLPAVLIPGDATGDGAVNADDAAILAAHWGETNATRFRGDFNADHLVNAADASILAANWGYAASEGSAVPEPGSLALLGVAAICILVYRSRRFV